VTLISRSFLSQIVLYSLFAVIFFGCGGTKSYKWSSFRGVTTYNGPFVIEGCLERIQKVGEDIRFRMRVSTTRQTEILREMILSGLDEMNEDAVSRQAHLAAATIGGSYELEACSGPVYEPAIRPQADAQAEHIEEVIIETYKYFGEISMELVRRHELEFPNVYALIIARPSEQGEYEGIIMGPPWTAMILVLIDPDARRYEDEKRDGWFEVYSLEYGNSKWAQLGKDVLHILGAGSGLGLKAGKKALLPW
jgi:hypothetical protein